MENFASFKLLYLVDQFEVIIHSFEEKNSSLRVLEKGSNFPNEALQAVVGE